MNQPIENRPLLRGTRKTGRLRRTTAVLATLVLLTSVTLLGQNTQMASAAEYPSWADVQAARSSVSAKEAQIAKLDGLLAALATTVETSRAEALQKGEEYQLAIQKFDDATYRLGEVQKSADAGKARADLSKRHAGQLAAQLARTGGNDLSTRLFFSGSESQQLLAQLGLATMVKNQSAGVYEKAIQDQKSAQSLTNQANRAKDALKVLSDAAQTALDAAVAASHAADAALAQQAGNKDRLEAQRAILVDNTTTTEAQYNEGVAVAAEAKRVADAIAAASAKAAAEKAAADKAAADAATPPSTGGGGAVGSGSNTGWVRPSGGNISSNFGWRFNPASLVWALHGGIDLAPGCNAPIVAAHSGTITYAGWLGGYGNFILMNNGDGIQTGYGHIVDGGTLVGVGQRVSAGQQIARVGTTGNSTGCHLHFETRPGGVAVDPAPFMRQRGVNL